MMGRTFVKITNEDIYREIIAFRKDLSCLKGQIKLNAWVGGTALTLVIGALVGLFL